MNRPRGYLLTEIVIALALLSVLLAAAGQMFVFSVASANRQRQRQVALLEAANLLERAAAAPWQQLDARQLDQLQPSAEARAVLPGATCHFALEELSEDPPAVRIVVRVEWRPGPAPQPQSVALASWRSP